MIECLLQIENKLGLHARPAALFVQTTNRFKSKIRVIKDDMEVDGKSIMGLLMLAAARGTTLKIVVDGEDETNLVEIAHPGFILMPATTSDPAFDFVRADYLSGIVAQRMEEGWTLMTVTDSSATLRR